MKQIHPSSIRPIQKRVPSFRACCTAIEHNDTSEVTNIINHLQWNIRWWQLHLWSLLLKSSISLPNVKQIVCLWQRNHIRCQQKPFSYVGDCVITGNTFSEARCRLLVGAMCIYRINCAGKTEVWNRSEQMWPTKVGLPFSQTENHISPSFETRHLLACSPSGPTTVSGCPVSGFWCSTWP